ncbi:MAG: neutral zinc metallopeptidase [Phycisphaerales bacterium]
MRWQGSRQSTNVEDRRRMSPGLAVGGGLGTLIIIVLALLLGGDPRALLSQLGNATQNTQVGGQVGGGGPADPAQEQMKEFVASVLASTEDVWSELFRAQGKAYRDPTLVLFTSRVNSACGNATAAVGPFYCPGDSKVYLDLGFFSELDQRFGAPGDFAQAYVVAHEIGHHVQNLLGISDQVDSMRRRMSEAEFNKLSVRLELQADFFAGVWAHHAQKARKWLEPGDLEEALNAATAIGDDTLQRQGRGYVVPDSFTHGSSAQRLRWFKKGFDTGDMRAGDTFSATEL